MSFGSRLFTVVCWLLAILMVFTGAIALIKTVVIAQSIGILLTRFFGALLLGLICIFFSIFLFWFVFPEKSQRSRNPWLS